MPKVQRNSSSGRFTVRSERGGKATIITDKRTGRILSLPGYGALEGDYVVRKGVDLSKPIAAQAARIGKSRRTSGSSLKGKRKKG